MLRFMPKALRCAFGCAALLAAVGCQTPSGRADGPGAVSSKMAAPSPGSVPTVRPAPFSGPGLSMVAPDSSYRQRFLASLLRLLRARKVDELTGAGSGHHSVQVLRMAPKVKGYMLVTSVGQRPTPGLVSSGALPVELVASSDSYSPRIAEVLFLLAGAMRRAESQNKPWRAYEAIALPEPIHNLQFFDLRPGGELRMDNGHVVSLLKVIPLTPEEFERQRHFSHDDGFDQAEQEVLARWRPVFP